MSLEFRERSRMEIVNPEEGLSEPELLRGEADTSSKNL